ncbi:motility associated factor glycosyltransferase family protein [Lysinibacillus piscis]|uniref:6-hydroxymethylpterin diphosphokinase MptE-like domain-containing protein n=1 Tax=Lysinibacillus piscis TaxID=2518931 RepID=A0ABQ5NHI3_9BACI|nr:6-hydroxymethylpterin diphosphokinase MptE-like protein [Lysinibacillus sp. KH24]GLC87825.1 hypothetical protein LYSBPC_09520 [Lysinibacillus sp. KH24]
MNFEKEKAKNGQWTLKLNGRYIYSKYNPQREATKNIISDFDIQASGYILIGLGLGYHLAALCELIDTNKSVQVVALNEEERIVFHSIEQDFPFAQYNIKIGSFQDIEWNGNLQIIIPQVWMNTIDEEHPLYFSLADIKMKQVTYKQSAEQMVENFSFNSALNHFDLVEQKARISQRKNACLVASGPSLKDTVEWLKEQQKELYILCVGSALNFLLNHGVVPNAVIISDPKDNIYYQVNHTAYTGHLFYLSTANYKTVQAYAHSKTILLQEGYSLAERQATDLSYPLLETGGSVATTGFSLLEYFGFATIFLFGQDLGFEAEETHVVGSTSGRIVSADEKLIEIPSNRGTSIHTTLNLYSYLKWFESKCASTKIRVYNTAYNGAVINNAQLVQYEKFLSLLKEC